MRMFFSFAECGRTVQFCVMAKLNEKRLQAKELYLTGKYTQKALGDILKVSQTSLTKWKKEDKWEDLKDSILITREAELKRLYKYLSFLNDYTDKLIADGNKPDTKIFDAVSKCTAAIKTLEIDLTIAEKVDVGTAFINLVMSEDVELAKQIVKWFDIFIKQSIK